MERAREADREQERERAKGREKANSRLKIVKDNKENRDERTTGANKSIHDRVRS